MSWCDRRRVILALSGVALLGGCFRPMLAEQEAASALRHRIALPAIDGRLGYYLYKRLEDRLGRPRSTDYRLGVDLELTERGLAIAQNNAVTRITVTARAKWAVYPRGGSEPLMEDFAISESGYNATGSLFATREARRDIERRLARDLGERISRRLLAEAESLARASAS